MVSADSQAAMEAAKTAVREFMMNHGQHDTSVHERVHPAVYHELISRTEHEEVSTAIDREFHLDHYHTSVQPVSESETLEEQHVINILPVERKTFEHDDREEVHRRVADEAARFRDEMQRVEGEHSQASIPAISSEHYHHHVHEVIQPIVNKHTIEPHIIHTLVQIHETHHQAARHHAVSALPVVSMAEFLRQGGVLKGREERYDFFQGEPRSVGGTLSDTAKESETTSAPAPAPPPPTPAPLIRTPTGMPSAPLTRIPTARPPPPEPAPAPTPQATPTPSFTRTPTILTPAPPAEQPPNPSTAAAAAVPNKTATQHPPGSHLGLMPLHVGGAGGTAGGRAARAASSATRQTAKQGGTGEQQQQQSSSSRRNAPPPSPSPQ